MKKQKFFMLGVITVLVAVLSLTFVSSTFARYTTSDSATDQARVAKWGVYVTASGDDAFALKYNDAAAADGTQVMSVNAENVVAPGTNGELGSIQIQGKPEVKVSITVDLKLELSGWEVDGSFYCPIVFSDGTTTVEGTDHTSAASLIAAVEALADHATAQVAANTDLAGTYDCTITWSWAIDTDNVKDSKLGNSAAGGTNSTIKATWSATVEQVD